MVERMTKTTTAKVRHTALVLSAGVLAIAFGAAAAPGADDAAALREARAGGEALRAELARTRGRVAALEARLAELSATVKRLARELSAVRGQLAGRGVQPAAGPAGEAHGALDIRVTAGGWGAAGVKDIHKVLESAGGELWKLMPNRRLAPIIVRHSSSGPITLYDRGPAGEYIVKLDVEGLFWCQFSYQFAHELCHILANYSTKASRETLWFEETVCELASIYTVRQMGRTWRTSPPYAHWSSYSAALTKYAEELLNKPDESLPPGTTLAQWYERNAKALRAEPCLREKNRLIAKQLLPLFEKRPANWQAVGYLNHSKPARAGDFAAYLAAWHGDVPAEHKPLVRRIAGMFGIRLPQGP